MQNQHNGSHLRKVSADDFVGDHTTIVQFGRKWQGCVNARYPRIVQVFGQPTNNGYDDTTDAKWSIKSPHGTVLLYNYKNGKAYVGINGTPTEDITYWQIRAETLVAAEWVQDALT